MKITSNEALYAAKTIYPNASDAKEISKGYSHKIFEVCTNEFPEKVIIKFANSKLEKFDLAKERRVHLLMQEMGIPVPRVILFNSSKKEIPFEFMILSYAEGIDLDQIWEKLSLKDKCNIFEQIGEIVGKIHQKSFDTYGYLTANGVYNRSEFSLKQIKKGVQIDPSELCILSDTLFDFGGLVANDLVSQEFKIKIAEYIIKNKNTLKSTEAPSLIHGDLDIINIKVKKIRNKWTISSLLDFEYAASTTKEYDFIKLHRKGYLDSKNLRDALLKGYAKYQEISENFDEKVKFMRICRDLGFATIMFKIGDLKTAQKTLDYIKKEITSQKTQPF